MKAVVWGAGIGGVAIIAYGFWILILEGTAVDVQALAGLALIGCGALFFARLANGRGRDRG